MEDSQNESKIKIETEQNTMGKISVETCEIEGLKVITPTVFGDARGYFVERRILYILFK